MTVPTSGCMTWTQAVQGPLEGATCLWQDLDGLHVEPAPAAPPPTSLLWAWRGSDHLVRARLDGDIAFVAVHAPDSGSHYAPAQLLPWSTADGRVAAYQGRGPTAEVGGLGAAYEQIVVDGISDGAGPITFLRPAHLPGPTGDNPRR